MVSDAGRDEGQAGHGVCDPSWRWRGFQRDPQRPPSADLASPDAGFAILPAPVHVESLVDSYKAAALLLQQPADALPGAWWRAAMLIRGLDASLDEQLGARSTDVRVDAALASTPSLPVQVPSLPARSPPHFKLQSRFPILSTCTCTCTGVARSSARPAARRALAHRPPREARRHGASGGRRPGHARRQPGTPSRLPPSAKAPA